MKVVSGQKDSVPMSYTIFTELSVVEYETSIGEDKTEILNSVKGLFNNTQINNSILCANMCTYITTLLLDIQSSYFVVADLWFSETILPFCHPQVVRSAGPAFL